MPWDVLFHPEFEPEFQELSEDVQDELLARLQMVRESGPNLGRPYADTLKGSVFSRMKELRFDADDGVWRFAFAFDPQRHAIVLVGGDKQGVNERRFYRDLIRIADDRFAAHVEALSEMRKKR
jgi:hypothetical protein